MLHTPSVVFISAARRKVECGDQCPSTYYCDYVPRDLYAIVSPYDVSVSLLRASGNCLIAQTYGHMPVPAARTNKAVSRVDIAFFTAP